MVTRKKTITKKSVSVSKKTKPQKKKAVKKIAKKRVVKSAKAPKKKGLPIMSKNIQADTAVDYNSEQFVSDQNFYEDQVDDFADQYITSWVAPEFYYHEKSTWWHIIVYGALLSLIVVSAFLAQWIAILVFLLLGVIIYQYADIKPRDVEIILTNVGVKVGEKFYPYNEIATFWVIFDPPVKHLNFQLTKRFSPVISLQLENMDPTLVKEVLREHILEDPNRKEDLIDVFSRFIRF